ncbi:MAG: phosphoesterase [Planctomycetota bacterium]|nr:phosphoesterase [Planctomycetota bacterium]
MTALNPIEQAMQLPSGARFYRCALQINPFGYLQTQKKSTPYPDEASYNAAIIQACEDNGIEVIGITDHYRVRHSTALKAAAEQAGIHVFPGFEAVTKDGVHFLCFFDPDRDVAYLERVLGDCGVHTEDVASPIGKYDAVEFLDCARQKWKAICVAAHVASNGGLLRMLSGQPRIQAWRSGDLLACSLPGPPSGAPPDLRPILENTNPEHRRERPVAVVNAQDVCDPQDLAQASASCWIKMSEVSVAGLHQAFLDPKSRVRLASDPSPEEHTEFVAMAWQGGFLDGTIIHFNENLNVLIGGRGTGKSTVIESLRHVLGLTPLTEDAETTHEGVVRHVLRSGTKISLRVRSHHPSRRDYVIERTIPNPPVVRDDRDELLAVSPMDIVPQVEIYGQHEISDLTKDSDKLTHLLDRFVARDQDLDTRRSDLRRELARSRRRVLDGRHEIAQVRERLAALPALEETLKRFQEAGLEERLKEQSLLVREERVLKTAQQRLTPFREVLEQLRRALPIDRAFLATKALEDLPGKIILAEADRVLEQFAQEMEEVVARFGEALANADTGLAKVGTQWGERKKGVLEAYEKILRDLQKSKIDGAEFMRLRQQIEELQPLRERLASLQRDLREHDEHRRKLLTEWNDLRSEEYRQLERAAKKVNKKLSGTVEVRVTFCGNREPLKDLLREKVGGRLKTAIETLTTRESLSLVELAEACRAGREALMERFQISGAAADQLTQANPEVLMEVEELDLPPTTSIRLNVAPEGQPAAWQALDELSKGQKATAVLLLLLLESKSPLVVDQPEDDLDNRFITEGVVPKMRDEKRRRQFVFATHNANIPVLGDAELILGLRASGEAGQGRAEIPHEHMGSIDAPSIRDLVYEVLEGGKAAFEMRRLKYGY